MDRIWSFLVVFLLVPVSMLKRMIHPWVLWSYLKHHELKHVEQYMRYFLIGYPIMYYLVPGGKWKLEKEAYIEQLDKSVLLDNVALVESRERKVKDEALFRQFKLTAMLKKKIHLTKADIAKMKSKRETGSNIF